MRVLGISAITDMAVGAGAATEISHADVLAAAERIKPRLARWCAASSLRSPECAASPVAVVLVALLSGRRAGA